MTFRTIDGLSAAVEVTTLTDSQVKSAMNAWVKRRERDNEMPSLDNSWVVAVPTENVRYRALPSAWSSICASWRTTTSSTSTKRLRALTLNKCTSRRDDASLRSVAGWSESGLDKHLAICFGYEPPKVDRANLARARLRQYQPVQRIVLRVMEHHLARVIHRA